MNRQFISNIVDGYITDNELNPLQKDHIENIIIETIESIKIEDYKLYDHIYELSKRKQKNLIYNILNEEILNENYLGIGAGAIGLIGIGSYLISLASSVKGQSSATRVSLQINEIHKRWTESKKKWKEIPEQHNRALDLIISDAYHDCLNNCGISKEFIRETNRITLQDSLKRAYSEFAFIGASKVIPTGRFQIFGGTKATLSESQVICLINCSLDSVTTVISSYAAIYYRCVRDSNELHNDFKINSILDFGKLPPDISMCSEIRKNFEEIYKDFKYILNFLYKDNHPDNFVKLADKNFNYWVSILDKKIVLACNNEYNKLIDVTKNDNIYKSKLVRFK